MGGELLGIPRQDDGRRQQGSSRAARVNAALSADSNAGAADVRQCAGASPKPRASEGQPWSLNIDPNGAGVEGSMPWTVRQVSPVVSATSRWTSGATERTASKCAVILETGIGRCADDASSQPAWPPAGVSGSVAARTRPMVTGAAVDAADEPAAIELAAAGELFMSVATVKAHVTHLLSKLDVQSRVQIALPVHDAEI